MYLVSACPKAHCSQLLVHVKGPSKASSKQLPKPQLVK